MFVSPGSRAIKRARSTTSLTSAGRELLLAARTYYVRTDGSDSNNGKANTAGGAFLTLQKAIDTVAALDISIYDVTIQVADGTYTNGTFFKAPLGAGAVIIQGNTTTPSNCLISCASDCFAAVPGSVGKFKMLGFKLQTSSGSLINVQGSGFSLTLDNMVYGAATLAHLYVRTGAVILYGTTAQSITAGAAIHMFAQDGGTIINDFVFTMTITGTPAFASGFAYCIGQSMIKIAGMVFSGATTGPRFNVSQVSLINTQGAGTSKFPGSVAGTEDTATFGKYT